LGNKDTKKDNKSQDQYEVRSGHVRRRVRQGNNGGGGTLRNPSFSFSFSFPLRLWLLLSPFPVPMDGAGPCLQSMELLLRLREVGFVGLTSWSPKMTLGGKIMVGISKRGALSAGAAGIAWPRSSARPRRQVMPEAEVSVVGIGCDCDGTGDGGCLDITGGDARFGLWLAQGILHGARTARETEAARNSSALRGCS